jgi:hypothetical protein
LLAFTCSRKSRSSGLCQRQLSGPSPILTVMRKRRYMKKGGRQ